MSVSARPAAGLAAAMALGLALAGCSSSGSTPTTTGSTSSTAPDGGSFARPPAGLPTGDAGGTAAPDGSDGGVGGGASQPGYVPVLEPFALVADCVETGTTVEKAACVQIKILDTDTDVDALQQRIFMAATDKDAANAENTAWVEARNAGCGVEASTDPLALARCLLAESVKRVAALQRQVGSTASPGASPSPAKP